MKPLVVASLQDGGGDRCIDILRLAEGYAWVEGRRDPEDPHGWRHLHPPISGYASDAEARAAAAGSTWLAA